MIEIRNHGPLIVECNYWNSEYAAAGKLIVSPISGVIRCLLPPAQYGVIGELRRSEYAIVSRGRWQGQEAIEILWEDHTDAPHAWHVTAESCLMLPGDPREDQWLIACWIQRRGKPHKALERACHWRRVEELPYMKGIGQ